MPASAASPDHVSKGIPLPPGKVTNLAGKTSPQPSCPALKPSEALTTVVAWSATLNIPMSIFGGRPSGQVSTQTYAVSSNGTFSASDASGNNFALAPLAGLPSGALSVSLAANSTEALQRFLVTTDSTTVADVTVSYSVLTSSCHPAGLRIEILGTANWSRQTGTVSIPFKTQPTFPPVKRTSANASAPYNPTRALFSHGSGPALAFDWSDSKKLSPTYDEATNSVDYQVGDNVNIDPVVTAAISRSPIATKADYEGFTCYASGRFWAFFNDINNEGYVSSADFAAWNAETIIPTAGTAGIFTFYCSGNSVYYAAAGQNNAAAVYFDKGTMNPDGTILWGTEGNFATTGTVIRGISTTLDSTGKWWVAFGSSETYLSVEAWVCATPSACTWTLNTSFPYGDGSYVPYAEIVPLSSGRMAIVISEGPNTMGLLGLTVFSGFGSGWGGRTYVGAGTYRLDASACVSIGDTVECGVNSGDTGIGYITGFYNGGFPYWGNFRQLLACSSSADCYASISTDGKSSLAITFANSATTVGYFQSSDSGSTWGPEIDFSTTEANPVYVSSATFMGNYILAAWTAGTTSPYNIRVAEAPTSFTPTPTPPWGQPGLSPYESYVNNAVVYVSMGNGLLSIKQPTFALPGRGLSVAPALFYNEPGSFRPSGVSPYQTDNFTLANLGLGWSLNFPWLGPYAVHLPDGQQYPYAWNGNDMQVHGPLDFELTSTTGGGVCPCTLTVPSGVQFAFNAAKLLVSESDPVGNTISFSYGTNGMLSFITDTIRRQISFGYNSNNLLTSMTAPGGRTWSFAYVGNRIQSVKDPVGRSTFFAYAGYAGGGWLANEVDYPTAGGRVTVAYGNAASPGGVSYLVITRNTYPSNLQFSQSDSFYPTTLNGAFVGNTMLEGDGNGVVQGYIVNSFFPATGVEKTSYENAAGAVFRVVENDFTGSRLTTTKTEDLNGNVLAQSSSKYDSWGNVIYFDNNVGQQSWLSYANTETSKTFGTSGCSVSGFYYYAISVNIHNRLIGACDFQNGSSSPQQEAFNEYDGYGQLIETKTSHNGGWLYADVSHDAYGNVLSAKDANGNYVYFSYASIYGSAYLTQQSRTVGPQVITTAFAYDLNTGFLTSTTDPNGQTSGFTYDAMGRTLTQTSPPVNFVSSV
ncbi:MAG: hypothetical protein OK452_08325, partial [Thaumarchaeota archaeon]|nr:hypothetical protein [Nitrososphaerota archaeon]